MNNFIHTTLQDRRKAKAYTGVIMMLFLLLLLLPFFSYQNPPPGQPGLLVSFGEPDAGQGSQAAAPPQADPVKEKTKPNKPNKKKPTKPQKKEEKPKERQKEKPKEIKTPIDEKVIAAQNEAIALEKQIAKEKADKKAKADARAKAESDKKKQELAAQREAERKQKENEEAARLAAAKEAAEAQKTSDFKDELANAFGRGDGGKPGNQGVKNGDPDADALKGLSTGSGKIGGGLSNRGGSGPSISDNSNKTGTVVVYVCISANGSVQSVNYTQKGSSTQDADLIKLAVDNARKWSFNAGIQDETCGTITYDFKVK
jgi:TonB family protein